MKTDHRMRYTKSVICDCFLELLKDQPIQKITVKAICEKADINRSTFYRYYKDAYDLMEQIANDLWEEFRQQVLDQAFPDTQHALEAMFTAIKNGRLSYITLLSKNTGIEYFSRMVENSYALYQDGFKRRYPSLSERQRRRVYYFLTEGCLAVTTDWIRGGMVESPEEMAHLVAQLDEGILQLKLNHEIS